MSTPSLVSPPESGHATEIFGHSAKGRALTARFLGLASSPRVLIIAGQHGDEPLARAAADSFASSVEPKVSLAVVSDANPDGAARETRATARGLDLNRDHLLLQSEETRALHRFVRAWQPDLIVDIHTYPPRRKFLLQRGLAFCHDVFIDVPTHANARHVFPDASEFLRTGIEALKALGYRSARYTRICPTKRVRHSTQDIVDARNGLALRYSVPTVLLEGRQPARGDKPGTDRRCTDALKAALEFVARWTDENRNRLVRRPTVVDEPIALQTRGIASEMPYSMEFHDVERDCIRRIELPEPYTPDYEVTQAFALPRAYAVPASLTSLNELLERHGFAGERQDDDVLYPVMPGSPALGVYLEPDSRYGLARYPKLGVQGEPTDRYQVLRVE